MVGIGDTAGKVFAGPLSQTNAVGQLSNILTVDTDLPIKGEVPFTLHVKAHEKPKNSADKFVSR